jgi:hypothetical protein
MRICIVFMLVLTLACQSQQKTAEKTENGSKPAIETAQTSMPTASQPVEEEISASQSQQKAAETTKNGSKLTIETAQTSMPAASQPVEEEISASCNTDVCLQLRNHNVENKSFEIFMVNAVPVAGFQCDLPGIGISDADGGLLKENGFEASNSDSRVLAFSMQGNVISTGMGVLTEISYSDQADEVCMTEIIFAGIGGVQLSNDTPECLKLN